jgi:hypothetical protein
VFWDMLLISTIKSKWYSRTVWHCGVDRSDFHRAHVDGIALCLLARTAVALGRVHEQVLPAAMARSSFHSLTAQFCPTNLEKNNEGQIVVHVFTPADKHCF